jgi:hypothetical protein
MASSGMLRRVALVRTDVSEELSASFIRVTGIGELGTTLAVTIHRDKKPRTSGLQYSVSAITPRTAFRSVIRNKKNSVFVIYIMFIC